METREKEKEQLSPAGSYDEMDTTDSNLLEWRSEVVLSLGQLASASAHDRDTALEDITRLCSSPLLTLAQGSPTMGEQEQSSDVASDSQFLWLTQHLLKLLEDGRRAQREELVQPSTDAKSETQRSQEEEVEQPSNNTESEHQVLRAPTSGTTSSIASSGKPANGGIGGIANETRDVANGTRSIANGKVKSGVISRGWEARQGAFLGLRAVLDKWGSPAAQRACEGISVNALEQIDDDEPRVRLAVGECISGIAHRAYPGTVIQLSSSLLSHIKALLDDPRCSLRYTQEPPPDTQAASHPATQDTISTQSDKPLGAELSASAGKGSNTGAGAGATAEITAAAAAGGGAGKAATEITTAGGGVGGGAGGGAGEGAGGGSEADAPSSPRADSDGLQAAMSWSTRTTSNPNTPTTARGISNSIPNSGRTTSNPTSNTARGTRDPTAGATGHPGTAPLAQGAPTQIHLEPGGAGGGATDRHSGGFTARSGRPEPFNGPGRSLETSVRAVQQLLESITRRLKPKKNPTKPTAATTTVAADLADNTHRSADRAWTEAMVGKGQVSAALELEEGHIHVKDGLDDGAKGGDRSRDAQELGQSEEVAELDLGQSQAMAAWPLLIRASSHPNRFVREASFFSLAVVFPLLCPPDWETVSQASATALAGGLGDNWSQVRYAASVALRGFLAFGGERRREFFSLLLPAMVFNRYYGAEGVRIYSQATWHESMGMTGRVEVARHIDSVIAFYISQSSVSNFIARETACLCIREVADKIERSALLTHVPALLRAASLRHSDMVWPVRVAACSASQRLVLHYPQVVESLWGDLLPAWKSSLLDSMPTVRQDSAAVFGSALVAVKTLAMAAVIPMLEEMLPKALKEQSSLVGGDHQHHQHHQQHHHHQHQNHSGSTPGGLSGGTFSGLPGQGLRVMRLDLAKPQTAGTGEGSHPPGDASNPGNINPLGSKFTVSYTTVKSSGHQDAPGGHQDAPGGQVNDHSTAADNTTLKGSGAGGAATEQSAGGLMSEVASALSVGQTDRGTVSELASALSTGQSDRGTVSELASALSAGQGQCQCCSGNRGRGDSGGAPTTPAWLQSEAAVFQLKELSAVAADPAAEFLPTLADLAVHCARGSPSTGSLLVTIWLQLPAIARGVGKRKFKAHLEQFLEALFASLTGTCASGETAAAAKAAASAAGQCIAQLQLFVGPSIFEGRLSPAQRQLLATYKRQVPTQSAAFTRGHNGC